jgi:hypothetical protein
MQVPFDILSDEARVWIYPASRPFSSDECDQITTKLNAFLTQWTAHGASLNAAVTIPYNRFIVIALDESQQAATGCSIDASVKIKSVTENTIVFNHLVVNKGEFLTQWEVPAHQSWHARYF